MARKKSALDLSIQWGHIFDRLERGANGRLTPTSQKRYDKAFSAYQRYDHNIRNSRPYTRAYDRAYNSYLANNPEGFNKYYYARSAGNLSGVQTKVSRSTYMGLANSAG